MPAGRPRSEAARLAILASAREELSERGFDKLTLDRVAARSGISKPTVYRWYRSKNMLVAECLLHGYFPTPAVEPRELDDARAEIIGWMREFAAVTKNPDTVGLIRAAIAAAAEDREIARGFRQQMSTIARDGLVVRLRRGIDAGQVRPVTSTDIVAEIIIGALVHRLFTYEEITEEFIGHLAAMVLVGSDMSPDADSGPSSVSESANGWQRGAR